MGLQWYECRDCGTIYGDREGDHCPTCGAATVSRIDDPAVFGVPRSVAKRRLAETVREFETPKRVSWGYIENRALALARLELGLSPLPADIPEPEVEDIRAIVTGEKEPNITSKECNQ